MRSIVARTLLGASVAVILLSTATRVAAQPPFMKQLPAASQPLSRPRMAAPDTASPRHRIGHWFNPRKNSQEPAVPLAAPATSDGRRLMHLPAVSQAMTPEIAADPLITSPRYATTRAQNHAPDAVAPAAPLDPKCSIRAFQSPTRPSEATSVSR
jgi:hypothetical protein